MSTLSRKCLLLKVRGSFPAKMIRRVRKQKLPANNSSLLTFTEITNHRRIRRRWTFTQRLAVIASHVQKRKRKIRGDYRSINFFATMMNRHIEKKNRACEKLLTDYTLRHKKLYQFTLRLLKLAKTKRLKAWRRGMYEYWAEIRGLLARAMSLLLWD